MKKIFFPLVIFWLFSSSELYSQDTYLNDPKLFIDKNKALIIETKLVNGLDLDRMSIIEKGIQVQMRFEVSVYQKNYIFPDEKVIIDANSSKSQSHFFMTRKLSYNYISRSYLITIEKNFNCHKKSNERSRKIYAGRDLKESYGILKKDFFEKKIVTCCNLSRLDLDENETYYISVKCFFYAVQTFDFPIPIPNRFNFETQSVKTETFELEDIINQ